MFLIHHQCNLPKFHSSSDVVEMANVVPVLQKAFISLLLALILKQARVSL